MDSHSQPTWGGYSSLNNEQDRTQESAGQSFLLRDQTKNNNNNNDPESDHEKTNNKDVHVTMFGQSESEDEDDDGDQDEEMRFMNDDDTPLANINRRRKSKYSSSHPSRAIHPFKILAGVFGVALVVSIAFAILSLLNLNGNKSLDQDKNSSDNETSNTNNTDVQPDNRVLIPPSGISVDDFKLSDFQLPPWDWDINSFVPIDITNGPKFTRIQWQDGEQYLAVTCQQPNYRYYFPSFPKNTFKEHHSTPNENAPVNSLLHIGDEPYVFVLCPPGNNNANIVMREFKAPEDGLPNTAPHPAGTAEVPQPLFDDVVMILVDAISRAKFLVEMKTVMETLKTINTTTDGSQGHRIFDFEHYNVLGQNSPPNKAYIYSGQSIENANHGPKHWIWDVYEEQGFTTAHTDGECGGQQGIHDYTTGAITLEYSQQMNRIPAKYQMPQTVWCHNHDMHVVANVWGQSCTVPPQVNYDTTLMGGMRWNTPYCAGEKAIHEHIMDNLRGWLGSTKGQRRFATYSFMDTHSPDHHHISFDKRLASLVQDLLIGQEGRAPLLSPNSALVIMADHGLHYGRETYTFPGFIHHKIPPLFLALPNKFLDERKDILETLIDNRHRILSHLDLHQTFIHMAYGDMPVPPNERNYDDFMTSFIADGNFRQRYHPGAPNATSFAQDYGRSILLPIEESRSCNTAGIPHDFCAFQPFLNMDPGKPIDAKFLRGALVLLAERMNNLTQIYRVDDVCKQSSKTLEPNVDVPSPTSSFDDIGTVDLVMESAYASATTSRMPRQQRGSHQREETRVFYFMVRDRHQPTRKYSVTMREDDAVMGIGDSITIVQMSAYAAAWYPCSRRIAAGGRAVGKWNDVVKHFCTC